VTTCETCNFWLSTAMSIGTFIVALALGIFLGYAKGYDYGYDRAFKFYGLGQTLSELDGGPK